MSTNYKQLRRNTFFFVFFPQALRGEKENRTAAIKSDRMNLTHI